MRYALRTVLTVLVRTTVLDALSLTLLGEGNAFQGAPSVFTLATLKSSACLAILAASNAWMDHQALAYPVKMGTTLIMVHVV